MHACSAPPKATQINCVSWPGDLVKVDDKVSSGGCGGWIQGEGPCFGAPGIRSHVVGMVGRNRRSSLMFMSTAVQLVLVPTLYVRTPFWLKLVITLVFFLRSQG